MAASVLEEGEDQVQELVAPLRALLSVNLVLLIPTLVPQCKHQDGPPPDSRDLRCHPRCPHATAFRDTQISTMRAPLPHFLPPSPARQLTPRCF